MGTYSSGTLRYDYEIKIDLQGLMDLIVEKLGIEVDECYLEDENLIIKGTESARYKHWHCNATLEEPAEDETELLESVNDLDIESTMVNALEEYKKWLMNPRKYVSKVEIDEESYEAEEDEPDPDRAYEEWRDRHEW